MTNFLTLVLSRNCFHRFGCCHQRRIQGVALGTIGADPCDDENSANLCGNLLIGGQIIERKDRLDSLDFSF